MALRGTNQEFGRPYNRRIVLESIRLHGPTTRGDIAKRVGLTVQTVSTIVRELEEQDYILSLREEPKGRGPAAVDAADQSGRRLCHRHPCHAARHRCGADQSRAETSSRALQREVANATPDSGLRDLIGAMVPKLTRLQAERPHARHRHGDARPVRRGVHELRRPHHDDRLEGRRASGSAWPS